MIVYDSSSLVNYLLCCVQEAHGYAGCKEMSPWDDMINFEGLSNLDDAGLGQSHWILPAHGCQEGHTSPTDVEGGE